ncbi:NAD-dependent epimerase/dehydratase family protein [Pseudobacteriovorax antillogorgiicola]|uniref:Nucleoside-diphosphate-sugar epimerase n=1 Tax=Pseudobacteriovorax antillogorgiicola TaxID=1513793 RepID=A0A1Y6BSH5_9BACT|nr:NAD(P)-dependent oxidoreductase [Pseudobacteriovorax antillogorgiicola]TCS53080.1 nucleoside-diphosphate-sugar epimerase [Pseudobacteriovorax antillogorgiicola]SMF26138.1 Nucleoside-diphosphate-sugar epimerase [Pseudobacteriovorax antillogorgiicola]
MLIAITGATSFWGSSLAMSFLMEGQNVLALSPHDPEGVFTKRAILNAAKGFKYDKFELDWNLLQVVSFDPDGIEKLRGDSRLSDVDVVWHLAEDESHDAHDSVATFGVNLTLTGQLHDIFSRASPYCQRFYFGSVLGSWGRDHDALREVIPKTPSFRNMYHASKWAAETNLFIQASQYGIPVTILRTPAILGHARTGWYGNQKTPLYDLIEAALYGTKQGKKAIRFGIPKDLKIPMVPINDLIDMAMDLTFLARDHHKNEVVHYSSEKLIEVERMMMMVNKLLGTKIRPGQPKKAYEKVANDILHRNQWFDHSQPRIEMRAAAEILGPRFQASQLDEQAVYKLAKVYVYDLIAQFEGKKKGFWHRLIQNLSLLGIQVKFSRPVLTLKELIGSKIL